MDNLADLLKRLVIGLLILLQPLLGYRVARH
jgi:hypothetical protein